MFKLFTILGFVSYSVKCEIVKGSFWQPSGGNSCGFTEPSQWQGNVVALSPLSKYYGRDTVSEGPDKNNFFQYPGCGIKCTLRCVEAFFEFPKDPCFDTSVTIEVTAVDTCPECINQVDIAQETFIQLSKQEAGIAVFELLCGEDIGQPVQQEEGQEEVQEPVQQEPVQQEEGQEEVQQPVQQEEGQEGVQEPVQQEEGQEEQNPTIEDQIEDVFKDANEFINKQQAIELLVYIVQYYNVYGITWQEHDSIKFWTLIRDQQ